MLRVALLDDHPAVLAGLRRLIDSELDLTVAAAASSATKLARELDGVRPDVLIVDYDLARATTGFRIAGASRIARSRQP
jgi:two-component system capsular synthesis response regulator RcsB